MFKDFVDLKLDILRYRTTKNLSTTFGKMLAVRLLVGIAVVFFLVLSFAFILLLGEVMGSYAMAAFVVAGVLLVVLAVLYLCRKKLFRNTFMRLFNEMLAGDKPEEVEAIRTVHDLDTAIAVNQSKAGPTMKGSTLREIALLGIRLLRKKLLK